MPASFRGGTSTSSTRAYKPALPEAVPSAPGGPASEPVPENLETENPPLETDPSETDTAEDTLKGIRVLSAGSAEEKQRYQDQRYHRK